MELLWLFLKGMRGFYDGSWFLVIYLLGMIWNFDWDLVGLYKFFFFWGIIIGDYIGIPIYNHLYYNLFIGDYLEINWGLYWDSKGNFYKFFFWASTRDFYGLLMGIL